MALALGTVLNGLRLRQRLSGLRPLESRESQDSGDSGDDFVFVHALGVEVDEATRRSVRAHAEAEGLDVVDLVPGDLAPEEALELARGVDTTTYRSAPFAAGRGGLHALLVRGDVWKRIRDGGEAGVPGVPVDGGEVADGAALVGLAERLKQHASRSSDLVVAPRLAAVEVSADERLRQVEALFPGFTALALAVPAARSALLLAGLVLSPGWGAAAAAGFALQPYFVTAGSPLRPHPRSLVGDAVGRIRKPFSLVRAALAGPKGTATPPDPIEARRPEYTAALAGGLEPFFERRRTTCPWCNSPALVERIRSTDLFQFKPGQFVVEECTACGLLFQNPRLSIEGLDFYYHDFYDGLGAGGMQFLFAQSGPFYKARVELARRHVSPRAWLDVGTGYGHFCLAAQGFLPGTRFDGLDMGESIEAGQRRRWIDNGYRGLFPDLAGDLLGRYDMVSMLHYLEHTRDPRAELDAAHTVLEPGGHLLIEVPDPECPFSRMLGRYWVPWLQPQHQQFLPVDQLCGALEAQGFSVVEVEACPPNPIIDLAGGLWMLASAWAPPPRSPWRRDPTGVERIQRAAIYGTMAPLALTGLVVDQAVQPLIRDRALRWSNAYRVLAQRQ
jgi:SAM-dependent methyltransferase